MTTRASPLAFVSSSRRPSAERWRAPSLPEAMKGAVGTPDDRPISAVGPRTRKYG